MTHDTGCPRFTFCETIVKSDYLCKYKNTPRKLQPRLKEIISFVPLAPTGHHRRDN